MLLLYNSMQLTVSSSSFWTFRKVVIGVTCLVIVRTFTEMNHSAVQRLTVATTNGIVEVKSARDPLSFPRVLHLSLSDKLGSPTKQTKRRAFDLPAVVREVNGNEMSTSTSKCPYKQDWHDRTYPTCNNIHEIDFFPALQQIGSKDPSEQIQRLGTGGTRDTWKIFDQQTNNFHNNIKQPLAFKTLRLNKEYIWSRIDHQRVDAIVSERLTFSPHVVDIYGYCGTATINEFGEGGTLDHYILNNNHTSPMQKLEYARDIAYALADLHELDGYPSSTVQHDLKPKNILVVANGKVKLGDFNNAHFLGKNTDQRCLFGFRQACEEMKIKPHAQECQLGGFTSEKIEVFQLGFILYFLVIPQAFGEPINNPPKFPVSQERNAAFHAIFAAIEAAFSVSIKARPTAREIGHFLDSSLTKIHRNSGKVK